MTPQMDQIHSAPSGVWWAASSSYTNHVPLKAFPLGQIALNFLSILSLRHVRLLTCIPVATLTNTSASLI